MNVRIIVNTSVDFLDGITGDPAKGDPLEERMRGAALEAVAEAVEYACGRGFNHEMSDIAGVCIQSVSFDNEQGAGATTEPSCPFCDEPMISAGYGADGGTDYTCPECGSWASFHRHTPDDEEDAVWPGL